MRDFADKSYLHPATPEAKAARAKQVLGRRLATHPRSTLAYSKEPTILTAFTRKRELERIAKSKRAA